MKKATTRAALIMLSFIMLLFPLASCVDTEDDPEDSTNAEVADDGTDSLYDEMGYLKDEIPADTRIDDTVSFLYWKDCENTEFFVEESSGDLVEEAIIKRNAAVERRLGVTFDFIPTAGNYDNRAAYLETVRNEANGGGGAYDIYASYSMSIATVASNGYCANLREYDVIDFEKPWWPDNLVREASIGDALYFASGDLSTTMLYKMYTMFFNKEIVEERGLTNPYSLVDSNNWTFENFLGMVKGVGLADANDPSSAVYGFASRGDVHFDPFFFAAGLNTTERDSNGVPVISESFGSERTDSVIVQLNSVFYGGYAILNDSAKTFVNGRALFALERADFGSKQLGGKVEFEYGILPTPKYDTNQENYYTTLAFPHTLYAISAKASDREDCAVLLECLCSEGYRTITPALFELTMKTRYTTDGDASRMFDIIRTNISFDFGRIYCSDLNEITWRTFRSQLRDNGSGISSSFSATKIVLDKKLEALLEAFAEIDN